MDYTLYEYPTHLTSSRSLAWITNIIVILNKSHPCHAGHVILRVHFIAQYPPIILDVPQCVETLKHVIAFRLVPLAETKHSDIRLDVMETHKTSTECRRSAHATETSFAVKLLSPQMCFCLEGGLQTKIWLVRLCKWFMGNDRRERLLCGKWCCFGIHGAYSHTRTFPYKNVLSQNILLLWDCSFKAREN